MARARFPVERLRGKTALITGASSGIGREFARQLARLPMDLVLVARREPCLRALAEDLGTRGIRIRVMALDLCREDHLEQVLALFEAEDITLLVNCAGDGIDGRFTDQPLSAALAASRLNALVPMALMHGALHAFRRRGGGAVINISSLLAFKAIPGSVIYAASKSFLKEISLGLAEEYAADDIQISTVCPGDVKTPMLAREYGVALAEIPPSVFTMEVVVCVQEILRRFFRGEVLIIPGKLNRLLAIGLRTLPRSWISYLEQRLFARD